MYTWSPLRSRSMPTLQQVRQAYRLADLDDDRIRDTRPLMSLLMRMRVNNPRLRGHILTRKTAVSSFDWQIVSADGDDNRTAQVRQRLTPIINEVMQHQVQAPLFDALCLELAWDTTTTVATPKLVRRYKPVELEKIDDYHLALVGAAPAAKKTPIDTADNGELFITDLSDDDERGGLLRSLVIFEMLRDDMTREWANYNKKLKGIVEAVYEAGASDEEVQMAADTLASAVHNNFTSHSRDIEFKVAEIVKGSGDSFRQIVEEINNSIAVAILGQANTSEIAKGSGSKAALQVLNLIRADIHYDDMVRTEDIINNQLLAYDYRRNYSASGSPPWRFSLIVPEEADFEARVAAIGQAIEAGIPMVSDELYKIIGMTKPANTADVFVKSSEMV